MKVVRLAHWLELKYGLKSEAIDISQDRIMAEVKRDVLDAYRNYFSRSARDSMFQYAADIGDPSSVELTFKVDKLVKNIDKLSPDKLIAALNEVIGIMYKMKTDPSRSVRQAIMDSIPGSHITQQNKRKQALIKYERSLHQAFPVLQKAAVRLQVLAPDVAVHGGTVSRQRGELSKQQLIDFILATPSFKQYGIDSFEVMENVLSDPELKNKLTTLVNSVNRGHSPTDGPAVQTFARQVKTRLEQKNQTNAPHFEEPEPSLPETESEVEE